MKKRYYLVPVLLLVAIFLGSYAYIFHKHSISTEPEDWAFFATFIGGIIGTILMLGNFFLLYYLNFQQSRDLQKPFGVIDIGDYEHEIFVRLKNIGAGPLIIEKVCVKWNEEEKNNLIEFMPDLPKGYDWADFILDSSGKGIAKGDSVNFILIEFTEDGKNFKEKLRSTLKDLSMEIHYKNIFNEHVGVASRNFKIFNRLL